MNSFSSTIWLSGMSAPIYMGTTASTVTTTTSNSNTYVWANIPITHNVLYRPTQVQFVEAVQLHAGKVCKVVNRMDNETLIVPIKNLLRLIYNYCNYTVSNSTNFIVDDADLSMTFEVPGTIEEYDQAIFFTDADLIEIYENWNPS